MCRKMGLTDVFIHGIYSGMSLADVCDFAPHYIIDRIQDYTIQIDERLYGIVTERAERKEKEFDDPIIEYSASYNGA